MAKRRRLVASSLISEENDAEVNENILLESAVRNRPGFGAPAPIARVAAEASAQAALAEVSEEMERARREGRLVLRLSLEQIDIDYLVRDRLDVDEEELLHLIESIREHGQRTPIEVCELASGNYGLISGWRRIKALSLLYSETGIAEYGEVNALLRHPNTAQSAYITMVEENEVRLGLSYYERARIAARAVDLGVFETEKQALQKLFAAASRARRSKIGSFLTIYRLLDEALMFPTTIPERLGLAVAKSLSDRPLEVVGLLDDLSATPSSNPATEQARLAAFVTGTRRVEQLQKDKADDVTVNREVCPGVFLKAVDDQSKLSLSLSGPNVNADLQSDLEKWLSARS